MDAALFWRGVAIGLAIAAPVGPIGLLCIQRTLQNGRSVGLATGLGAATADALYGFVAAFGLTFVSGFLVAQQQWLALFGGLFLLYLGVRTFRTAPPVEAAAAPQATLLNAYLTTLLLTLTNPVTILSFVAIFAGLGLAAESDGYEAAALLVAGVFCGSAAWWLLLSGAVSLFRRRFSRGVMRWVNRLAGVIIGLFGLLALGQLLR